MAKRRTKAAVARPVRASNRAPDFTWKVGGEAGTGIKNSALILAKAFIRGGYWVHANVEYPSIVRGGNNTLEVRMSSRPVRSLTGQVNLLAALDARTVHMWRHEIIRGGALIVDRAHADISEYESDLRARKVEIFDVPVQRLLDEQHLPPIMRNSVVLGAICGIVCYDLALLELGMEEVYSAKGKEVVDANKRAAMAGFEYVESNFKDAFVCQPHAKPTRRILLEGNEAVLLGALKSGMSWYSGYPMTPTSSLLHFGAGLSRNMGLVTYQSEDEISAVQMALGASYAGARAMTGTSGGGFSLMTETLGLAAMTETPLTVLLGMRPGPATGLPTRTGQGDLRFAMHASQDEPPRIVLAPGDPAEALELAFHALDIADRYQLLVILLADKYLLENFWTHEPIVHAHLKPSRGKVLSAAQAAALKSYERFAITKDGVSPLVLPGTRGLASIWRVSADEHNTAGFITENRANRVAMVEKRRRKVDTAYRDVLRKLQPVTTYGNPKAKRAVVSFGSNKGVLLDALDELGADSGATTSKAKPDWKVVLIRCVMPFPSDVLTRALKGVDHVSIVEGNDSGLLEGIVREQTGITADDRLRFYDGRPLTLPTVLKFLS